MMLTMLKSKLHRGVVTQSDPDYEGSITIDAKLLQAADIFPHEKVLVANLANGERFETYAMPGEPDAGLICLNGATAHKGEPGDRVIVFTFATMDHGTAASHTPKVVLLDEHNRPITGNTDV